MNMKHITLILALFAALGASAQQVNPVPDYVFRNQMSVGRNAVTDTAAYFSIGPRYGATKGFMPPIVGDTATFSSGKRNGLLIFSVQKNKFLYWDSVRVQWSDMAGSSGSYITGKGITGYVPQFSDTATLDTSALYTLGNQLGVGTSSFAYTGSGRTVVELNGTAGGLYGFKRNDSARGYLWHTGDNMELANTVAGSISFNTNSATRGSISSAGVWRLHNLAGTGDRVVQASSNGTLSATTSVTGLVDTLTISTRAWRQKGIDSVVSIIPAAGVGGSGTTNYVPKFTASTTIGNSQIFDNGTNVGVGNNNPGTAKLQITGPSGVGGSILFQTEKASGFGSTELFQYYNTGGTDYGSNFGINVSNATNGRASIIFKGDAVSSNGTLIFNTNNTERLRITSGGDVGIGTTSPGVKLDIVGSAGTIARIKGGTGSAQGSAYYVQFAGSTSTMSAFGDRANIFGGTVDQIASIYTGSSIPLTFDVNAAERMRIFANGRVGINTTTDAGYQLDINGTLRSVNGANFATTSGNVGIGTASPAEKLDVTSTLSRIVVTSTTNSNNAALYFNAKNSGGTNVQGGVYFIPAATPYLSLSGDNSGTHLNVTSAGNVGIGTASPLSKLHAFGAGGSTAVKLTLSNGGDVNALNDPMGVIDFYSDDASGGLQGTKGYLGVYNEFNGNWDGSGSRYDTYMAFGTSLDNSLSEKMRIKSDAELLINTTTDAGDYKLQVSGNIYNTGSAVLAAAGGGVAIGTTTTNGKLHVVGNGAQTVFNSGSASDARTEFQYNSVRKGAITWDANNVRLFTDAGNYLTFWPAGAEAMRLNTAGEVIIDASGTDAGDYKLQVVGNARIGTGKLDIASNTTFGIGVARSGTSEVAGQIYNSNGILYLGAESSAGGQIFSGSSAYAAVIGSGANYPLQFATNNATRATINTNGELLINTTTDNGDFKLQVNGNALISGSIKTANGGSSTAVPWHLGSVIATSVQLDTNNYVEVEINGVYYRLAIVTPL